MQRIIREQESGEAMKGSNLPENFKSEAETRFRYGEYIEREHKQVAQQMILEKRKIPSDIEYGEMSGISQEAREKLTGIKPETLGQAARTLGTTPADFFVLAVWLGRREATGKVTVSRETRRTQL